MGSNTLVKILVGFSVTLLLLFAVAEGGLRYVIHKELTASQSEGTEVEFGTRPLVLSLLQGKLGYVEMTKPSTLEFSNVDGQISASGEPAAHVVLRGMPISEDPEALIDSVYLDTTIPKEFIQAQLQSAMREAFSSEQPQGDGLLDSAFLAMQFSVSDVRTNPKSDTFEIVFGDGIASIEVHPHAIDGKFQLTVEETNLFGFGLPDIVADYFTKGFADSTALEMFDGLTASTVEVTDEGLHVVFEGTDVKLSSLQATL
ncbi:LmeA family phospholipid-binding protein [Corynebacterium sp. HS2168-gen11]|uniref:LmeA family phospholipid-binding protein n=1 Tax=Corynebacterium sp. HS2168-gen11 TaxID=2974027 RepID=UPI00216B0CAB|nr:LmeA family phospholipid-binding protein [Corynebacterium sp. HS2168-gen11]MCS4535621.1 LmeA family phospholipid-binding protein [Corynebacterium sp. HS2168-gen11]